MKSLVVFEPHNDHWIAPLLHKEWKHVYCAFYDEVSDVWISVSHQMHETSCRAMCNGDFDLASSLRHQGCAVFEVEAKPTQRTKSIITLNSCVSLTKNILGIKSWALTPAHLHAHLSKKETA